MTREEMILKISEKLQKQMHMINSEKQRNSPKMLCDNLASRVFSVIEDNGMKPPNVSTTKAQYLLKKYVDPEFSYWDEDFDEKEPEFKAGK